MGLRDYTMFLLIATYGLRASEIVALSLDDIRLAARRPANPSAQNLVTLELPLTNEVLGAMVKHLKRTPPPAPYRRVFLRMRAPIGVLKPTAVNGSFSSTGSKEAVSAFPIRPTLLAPLVRPPSLEEWNSS